MPRSKHDVFLSFCGKDTGRSFTDHLYFDLKRKGILVFRDDESLERGKCISQELLQAIQESRYAIVIFSANYASSKWCLRELAKIVEWEEKKNLTIIPIFYHVDPSDVRNRKRTFAEAFAAHEKDPKVDIEEIDTWRKACTKVGNISGEHINGDRYETEIIQEISGNISRELINSRSSLHDNKKFVGIDSRVEEMMNLLHMESNDVRFVGIHGMGGVGKTTLAKIIYDRVSSNCQFEGRTIISFNGEKSTARDLASLQTQLLSGIMQERIEVSDPHKGIEMIRSRMQNKKVFIVLDNVDSDEQLEALAGDHNWFGPRSRVIITCRDSHLFKINKVNDMCAVQLLQPADALELFSLSAFDETHPPEDYKDLSMAFVEYAGGLPLALKVLGRSLCKKAIEIWEDARDHLKGNPPKEISEILQISFDGLGESQEKLFLDVACFSGQWIDVNFRKIYSADVIEVLIDKSLVSTSKDDVYFKERLTMHDLLKEMGQQIVRRECPQEPGRRSRLFHHEDVFHVLKNNTGTDAIEGIVMDLLLGGILGANHSEIINAEAFSKMRNLRLLYFCDFGYIKWSGNPLEYMPSDKFQFLRWSKYPSKSWPSSFQPKNLVVLEMPNSCIEQLWMESMVLPNLKELDLSHCKNLIEIPDLSGASNLEKVNFSDCNSLCKFHPSIKKLKRLQKLNMSSSRIKQLWNGSMVFDNLKELDLSCCKNLIETPDLSGFPNLEKLDFSYCISLCKVHPSIKKLKRLQELKMSGTRIKQLWKGLVVFDNLKELDLSCCENLIETSDLSRFPNLEKLDFSYCRSLCKVHPSIVDLKGLKILSLNKCLTRLLILDKSCLPSPFMSFSGLRELYLRGCNNISIFPSVICSLSSLESLHLVGWSRLEKFPDLNRLECLKEFEAYGTAITQMPPVNLIPKNIRSLKIEGRKRMPRKSRDHLACLLPKQSSYPTNRDTGSPVEYEMEEMHTGSPVEYEMEEMLDVEALQISFGSSLLIEGWSLGSRIPAWVHNKSTGSSLQIELDGNTTSVIGCAIFIVFDCHQFHSPEATSIPRLFNVTSYVTFSFCCERDDGSLEHFFPKFSLSLVKPSVCWAYARTPRLFKCLKSNSSDNQSFIKISIKEISPQTPVEVKEWGIHLVCPDDIGLGLGSDLDSYRQFYSAWKCGMTRNED
ncbi:disease resistance protein RPV1-like isoform X2 [Carya illinoinensis]|uniref:disease resistance protein RPV1-like isoform X2 n=1 Tax=Carya illinoinensis TaxID=32201 RepID=UPI001C719684|nr:disease resistance protein RPV1-like isoform X2 [Carya illinoinensis]